MASLLLDLSHVPMELMWSLARFNGVIAAMRCLDLWPNEITLKLLIELRHWVIAEYSQLVAFNEGEKQLPAVVLRFSNYYIVEDLPNHHSYLENIVRTTLKIDISIKI